MILSYFINILYLFQSTSSLFKLSVSPNINFQELLALVIRKKGPSIGITEEQRERYVLKICGLEEYLIGPYPLSQYKVSLSVQLFIT